MFFCLIFPYFILYVGCTAYHIVAGAVEAINALLDCGAAVNYQGRFGLTALHRAAENGHKAFTHTKFFALTFLDLFHTGESDGA
jgi:ankyrin repeat protein